LNPVRLLAFNNWIEGRRYTHDGAVKLVRDFEASL
jgi:hypothetical protein